MTNKEAINILTEQLAYSGDVLPARIKAAYEVAINSIKNRADVIEEVFWKIEERLNDSTTVTLDLPVEEVLGDNVDMDDFLMLAEEIVQEYKDLIFSKLAQAKKQLKEKKE